MHSTSASATLRTPSTPTFTAAPLRGVTTDDAQASCAHARQEGAGGILEDVRWCRPSPEPEHGCVYCRDLGNRLYGHPEYAMTSSEDGLHLLRCPRCEV